MPEPLVMAVASAALGGMLLGLALGLWLGERSRRIGAERMLQYGQFDKPKATIIRPEPDAEERALNAAHPPLSAESIKRGVDQLTAMYREHGYPVPDESQLRLEAEMMLNGETPDA